MAWDDLSERWELASLGDIAQDVQTGFARSARDEEGLPHLRPNNVGTDGRLDLTLVKRVPFEAGDLSRYDLKPEDVLFNNTNSQELVGKTAIFDLEGTYSFSNHLTRIRVRPDLLIAEWLSFWFQHLWRTRYFERICNRWIGQAGINTKKLSGVEVPLPSLSEQRRIVARIKELTEPIDAARRLRAEAIEEADAIVRTAALKAFRELECEEVPLGEVTDSSRYGTSKRASVGPVGYPMLRMNNITLDGTLDLTDLKYVQVDEREFAKLRLHPGDIVVNRTNSKELVGKCAVFHDQDADYVFASYLIRFRLNESEADSDYVVYYLSSPLGRGEIDARSHGATNQFNINAGELKSIPIPLPPLNGQHRIVEYLDTVQAKVEAIRRYQQETQQEIKAMTGAVLDRAFRGEL